MTAFEMHPARTVKRIDADGSTVSETLSEQEAGRASSVAPGVGAGKERGGQSVAAAEAEIVERLADLRLRSVRGSEQAKQAATEFVGRPLKNAETEIVATVSGESLRKLLSRSAFDKSISREAHRLAVGNLDRLFPLATLRETRPSKKSPEDITAVRHFDVPMPFDGEVLRVKIMAKEFVRAAQGTRIYLVQAVELEKPAAKRGSLAQQTLAQVSVQTAGFEERFARMVAAVKSGRRESRATVETRGQSPAAAEAEIVERLGPYARTLIEEDQLRVVANAGAIPRRLLGAERGEGARIEGVSDLKSGAAYLVAENLPPGAAARVALHELVHLALVPALKRGRTRLQGLLGDRYTALIKQLKLLETTGDEATRRIIREARAAMQAAGTGAALEDEELLAYSIDRHFAGQTSERIRGWVDRVLGAIRQFLFRLGFTNTRLTLDDLVDLAKWAVRDYARQYERTAGEEVLARRSMGEDDRLKALLKQYARVQGAPSEAEIRAAVQQYRDVERQYAEVLRAHDEDGKPLPAPNGQPSELNREQWILVRTPNFKRWFGDWLAAAGRRELLSGVPLILRGDEIADFVEPLRMPLLREQAKDYAAKNVIGRHVNRFNGAAIEVRAAEIDETLQHGSGPDKIRALAALPAVLTTGAVVYDGANPKNQRRRLVVLAKRVTIGNIPYYVTAGAREDANGRLFYDHEILQVDRIGPATPQPGEGGGTTQQPAPRPTRLNHYTADFINRPVAASPAIDENGEPQVMYRVSNREPERAAGTTYWASNPAVANTYMRPYPELGQFGTAAFVRAGAVLDAGGTHTKLRAGHEAIWRAEDTGGMTGQAVLIKNLADPDFQVPNRARQKGRYAGDIVVVPKAALTSIKSATGNIGTYSEREDMRFSKAGPEDARLAALVKQYAAVEGAPSEAEIRAAVQQYRDVERQYAEVLRAHDEDGKPLPAPNGQPSELNREQWILTRTPNFKRWAGVWDLDRDRLVSTVSIDATRISPAIRQDTKALREWLLAQEEFLELVTNLDSGFSVGFTVNRLKDSLKRKGEAQRMAYGGLRDLIEQAVFVAHEPSDRQHLQGQDIYFVPMQIEDRFYSVKIKVDVDQATKESAYKDHKAVQLEVTPAVNKAQAENQPIIGYPQNGPTRSGATFTLRELLNDYQPKASTVLDKNGEPRVVYHGSYSMNGFTSFSVDKIGARGDIAGRGYYFAEDPAVASHYAQTMEGFTAKHAEDLEDTETPHVMAVFLNARDPISLGFADDQSAARVVEALISSGVIEEDFAEDAKRALTEGTQEYVRFFGKESQQEIISSILEYSSFDSVEFIEEHADGDYLDKVVVVFNEGQIKSATGNVGTYSEREDMRFSKTEDFLAKPDVPFTQIQGNEIQPVAGQTLPAAGMQWARQNLQGHSFTNADTQWEIAIGRKGINKTMSHAAKPEQVHSLVALPGLLEHAVKMLSQENTHPEERADVPLIHHFYAPLRMGRQDYLARMVIKETSAGHKFYDHDLTVLEKSAPSAADAHLPEEEAARHRRAGLKMSMEELLRLVKPEHRPSAEDLRFSKAVPEAPEITGLEKRRRLDESLPVIIDDSAFVQDKTAEELRITGEKEFLKLVHQTAAQPIINRYDGKRIIFTHGQFGKPRSHSADPRMMRLVPALPELLERAVPLYAEPETNPERFPNIKAWHTYAARAVLGGHEQYVQLTTFEEKSGKEYLSLYHDHNVTWAGVMEKGALAGPDPITNREVDQAHLSHNKLYQWYHAQVNDGLGARFSKAVPEAPEGSAPENVFAAIDAATRESRGQKLKRVGLDKLHSLQGALRRQVLGALTVHQLVETGRGLLPRLEEYWRHMQALGATAMQRKEVADRIAERWAKLPEQELSRLAYVMHEATLAGVDPAVEYRESINIAEAAKKIRIKQQQARGRSGEPTGRFLEEIAVLKRQIAFEQQRLKERGRLAALWAELSPAAQEIYRQARDFHVEQSRLIERALLEVIEKSQLAGKAKAEAIAQMRQKFEAWRVEAPYFPLGRQGDYWVYLRQSPEQDAEFHMFQTIEQQEDFIQAQTKDGWEILGRGKQLENLREVVGVSAEFVARVQKLLESVKDTALVKNLQDQVYQLYLATLPELSARRHHLHRKNTLGFGKDALLSFADKSFHDAYSLARLKHGFDLRQSLEDLRADLETANLPAKLQASRERLALLKEFRDQVMGKLSTDQVKERAENLKVRALEHPEAQAEARKWDQFADWMEDWARTGQVPRQVARQIAALEVRHATAEKINARERGYETAANFVGETEAAYQHLMNPNASPWANLFNQVGFVSYLAFSPSAWIVNALQTPVVALPYVAAKFGMGGTARAFARRYRQAFTRDAENLFSIRGALNEAEKKAYDWAAEQQIIDRTRSHDLAGLAEEGTARSGLYREFMQWSAAGFHHAERLNREVTFLAAYDMAKAAGMAEQAAREYAAEAVHKTHLVYTAENRPRFLRSNWARVIGQFKLYAQGMTFLQWQAVLRALPERVRGWAGLSPEVQAELRQEARRFLLWQWGTQFAAAGALGLPVGGLWLLAKALFGGDEDEPKDFEGEFRQAMADLTGSRTGGDILSVGLINALTPVDLHSRLSLRDLWLREPNKEVEGRDLNYYLLTSLLGPMASLAENFLVGAQLAGDGHVYRGIERMLPGVLNDALKAGRFAVQGQAETLKGDTLAETNFAEALLQLAGFTPSQLEKRYALNQARKNTEQRIQGRRSELLARLNRAKAAQDAEDQRAARAPPVVARLGDRWVHPFRKDIFSRERGLGTICIE